MTRWLIAAVVAAFALLTAAPAHADEQTYLADVAATGVPLGATGLANPDAQIHMGYKICNAIHGGESAETAGQHFGWMNQWGPGIVSAAQHDLCPDTLH